MAVVNIFLLVNYLINILPGKYYKTVFSGYVFTWQFASITSRVLRFFEHRYFTR